MKISLALSGGGIRAMAHLGVVEVLRRNGFEIAAISGSSGGAIVGALLSDGRSPKEILEIMKGLKLKDLAGSSSKGGFFGLGKLEMLLKDELSVDGIEDLDTPFVVACTDLTNGKALYFDKGSLTKLCMASSSLVPIFSPVRYENLLLADGGFMDNMPTKPLEKFNYPIVAINVNPIPRKEPKGMVSTTVRALVLMMSANIKASAQFADFYIEPPKCGEMNIFDLKRGVEAYEEGVRVTEESLKKLKNALLDKKK